MKRTPRLRRIFFTWVVLAAVASAADTPADLKLFLLIGQSNMAGRGAIEEQDKVPLARVWALNKELTWAPAVDPLHWDKPTAGVGLGRTFGRVVAEKYPGAQIGLIPAAFGGTSLDQWTPGGELYTNALERARRALKDGKLTAILWHQGESEKTPQDVATYTVRFRVMITQLRRELGAENLPLIVGELGEFRPENAAMNAVLAKLPEQIPNCVFVSAAGLVDRGDKLHFDSASFREFGRRYAKAYLESVEKKPAK
jgi:hypothetical protein